MSNYNERHFTRKCKPSSLLNEPYKKYRQEIRKIAEEYSIIRRDAMNLALYSVYFWADNGYHDDPNTFPPVLFPIFWSHCFQSVALGEEHVKKAGFNLCV